MHGEFDYPYPYDDRREAEVQRLAAQRERRRRIEEIRVLALVCVRALGRDGTKPEWGSTVRQAVLQVIRQALPTGSSPMDVDRFEDVLREVADDKARSGRAAGAMLENPAQLSALEHAVKVVRAARGKAAP